MELRKSDMYLIISNVFIAVSFLADGTAWFFTFGLGMLWFFSSIIIFKFEREADLREEFREKVKHILLTRLLEELKNKIGDKNGRRRNKRRR